MERFIPAEYEQAVYEEVHECNHCGGQIEMTEEIVEYLLYEYEPSNPEFCQTCWDKFEAEDEAEEEE